MAIVTSETGLEPHGLDPSGRVVHNPTTSQLYTDAIVRGHGRLAEGGPLAVDTGRFTGRSPQDKFVVDEPGSRERIWWGNVNQPLDEDQFDGLRAKVVAHLNQQATLYVMDAFAGADPEHRIGVRVVTASPYHALFAKTMFIAPTEEELIEHDVEALVLHAPEVEADPVTDGTRTGTFVVLHPSRSEVVIGGTFYAGEIKKSIFTVMNDRLPLEGVFPMHCSANVGDGRRRGHLLRPLGYRQDDALGRPGAAPDRRRRARLGRKRSLQHRGRVLRKGDPPLGRGRARHLPHDAHVRDDSRERRRRRTGRRRSRRRLQDREHSRGVHPGPDPECVAGEDGRTSRNVVFLTADAFGILPPLARLSRAQALWWFLSGFTAKLAGTEIGVTEPQPTFSTCFGAPFLPQRPSVYARMLGEKLDMHGSSVWLVNTGWTGGPFGEGHRMPIAATRALLSAALSGALDGAEYRVDPVFGFEVPVAVPGVDTSLLDPRSTWADAGAYDDKARYIAERFRANFEEKHADDAGPEIAAGGPARRVSVKQLRLVVTAVDSLNSRLEGPAGLQLTLFQELGDPR